MYTLDNFGVEKIEKILPNGLKLVFIKKPFAPIYFDFSLRAGSLYDPVGLEGIAHLSEHLLVAGSHTHSKESFARIMGAIGGLWNAGTSQYRMNLYCEVASTEHLANVHEFFQHALLDIHITDEMLEAEKKIVFSEIERAESDPDRVLGKQITAYMGAGTPYAHSVLGSLESVSRIQTRDVINFLKESIVVENMALTVCGGCELSDIETLFGSMKFASGMKRELPHDPDPLLNKNTRTHFTSDVPQTKVIVGFLGPNPYTRESLILRFALSFVHDDISSLMYRKIRNERQLAYSINFSVVSFETFGYYGTTVGVSPESVDEVIALIRDCYREYKEIAMTDEEVSERIRSKWFSDFRNMERSYDWVSEFKGEALYPSPTNVCGDFPDIHNYRLTYTAQEIRDVLEKYVQPEMMNVITGGR